MPPQQTLQPLFCHHQHARWLADSTSSKSGGDDSLSSVSTATIEKEVEELEARAREAAVRAAAAAAEDLAALQPPPNTALVAAPTPPSTAAAAAAAGEVADPNAPVDPAEYRRQLAAAGYTLHKKQYTKAALTEVAPPPSAAAAAAESATLAMRLDSATRAPDYTHGRSYAYEQPPDDGGFSATEYTLLGLAVLAVGLFVAASLYDLRSNSKPANRQPGDLMLAGAGGGQQQDPDVLAERAERVAAEKEAAKAAWAKALARQQQRKEQGQ